MKTPLSLTSLFLVSVAVSQGAITVPTTDVYDVPANSNAVDAVAGIGVVTPSSPAETSLNSYKTAFATAFSNGTGGVIQFDGWAQEPGDATPETNPAMVTTYGTSTLTISRPTGNYQFNSSPITLGNAISGSMYLRTEGDQFHLFNFSTPLSVVGFTVMSRNTDRTVQATVTYFDGGTAVISGEVITAGTGTDDTFFGFTAPTGRAIVSLRVEATATGEAGNNYFAIDDLGYVVSPIPEPSVGLLALTGLAGLFIRRRRI